MKRQLSLDSFFGISADANATSAANVHKRKASTSAMTASSLSNGKTAALLERAHAQTARLQAAAERQDSERRNTSMASIFSAGKGEQSVRRTTPLQHSPRRILSWNCNSFGKRLESSTQRQALEALLVREDPDVIMLQETKLQAAGADRRDEISTKDKAHGDVQRAFQSGKLLEYSWFLSCHATKKYCGVALGTKKLLNVQKHDVWYDLDMEPGSNKHHEEARVIGVRFPDFVLLNTYVPNIGSSVSSVERRKLWNDEVTAMAARLRSPSDGSQAVPLVWGGDLNVCPEDVDVSHPSFFNRSGFFEKKSGHPQAGFKPEEREHFRRLLDAGALVDSYRHLHPVNDAGEESKDFGFTWSGWSGGRYSNRHMRLDYFLISHSLLPRLESSIIQGRAAADTCGSDHLAVSLRLKPHETDEVPADRKETN